MRLRVATWAWMEAVPRVHSRRLRMLLASGIVVILSLVATQVSWAQTFSVLYEFNPNVSDGFNPYAGLVADSAGNFYGTTFDGGAYGHGAVYELSASGVETVLYSFKGGKGGGNPVGGLIRDAAGNLYGTTEFGGIVGGACPIAGGCGTIFRISPQGHGNVLYEFTGGSDGAAPLAGLVGDAAGSSYGTTSAGGLLGGSCPSTGCGVVFKLSRTGGETTLHTFAGYPTDGEFPVAALAMDSAGNLYGSALGGSTSAGVIFEVSSSGSESILHNFEGSPNDGSVPEGSLTRDAGGNLYGTTGFGGVDNFGVVFELDPVGNEAILYSFSGGSDGRSPLAGVVLDSKGNLYGTTGSGGNLSDCGGSGCGVIFKLSPARKETVLHTFNSADGAGPFGNLLPYRGSFYGTTVDGGGYSDGEVFKIVP